MREVTKSVPMSVPGPAELLRPGCRHALAPLDFAGGQGGGHISSPRCKMQIVIFNDFLPSFPLESSSR